MDRSIALVFPVLLHSSGFSSDSFQIWDPAQFTGHHSGNWKNAGILPADQTGSRILPAMPKDWADQLLLISDFVKIMSKLTAQLRTRQSY